MWVLGISIFLSYSFISGNEYPFVLSWALTSFHQTGKCSYCTWLTERWLYLDRSSEVWTVGCWLWHHLVESLAWSLPVWCLNSQESSNGQSNWQSKHPSVSSRSDDGSHQWEGESVAKEQVGNELSTHLLELPEVELFHLKNFPFSQVIILKATNDWSYSLLHRYR